MGLSSIHTAQTRGNSAQLELRRGGVVINNIDYLGRRATMKRALLILVVFLLASCSATAPGDSSSTPASAKPKTVYLVTGQGQLAAADLQAHPEVVVVHSFRDLQARATDTDISLWIDKDAVQLVDSAWLMQSPQKLNPLVVVGYNQALYALRDTLHIGIGAPISGPYVDWSTVRLEPGFSVWVLQPHREATSYSAFMQGYDQAPTVQAILAITDPLIGVSH
jgi:hypothetical protein